VSGSAPEERRVFFLTDPEAIELAGAVVRIERLHGGPVEVQWARDGETGEILVVHAGLATAPARAGSHVSRTGQTGEPRRRQAVSTGLSIGTRGLAT
jgi:pyruvate,water dikinase